MRAMFWKEVRENWKWALLALAGLTCLDISSLWNMARFPFNGSWYGDSGVPSILFISMPATGIALGLLQMLREVKPDRWAFLVHRPVGRTAILWGKLGAGAVLYLIATVPSFAITLLWLVGPGRAVVPFDIGMALPGVIEILSGLSFYLATMAAMVRPSSPAHLYGSRFLGTAAAMLAVSALNSVPEFWQALLVTLGSSGLMLLAALGNFHSGGVYAKQSRTDRLAQGAVHWCGLEVCLVVLIGLCFIVKNVAVGPSRSISVSYEIEATGQVVRAATRIGEIPIVTDLAGNAMAKPAIDGGWKSAFVNFLPLSGNRPKPDSSYRSSYRYFIPLNPIDNHWNGDDQLAWFYRVRDGKLLGYSVNQRRVAATVSATGMVAPESASALTGLHRNHGGSSIANLYWTDHEIYRVDLMRHQVQRLVSSPSVPIREVVGLAGNHGQILRIAWMAGNRVRLAALDGRLLVDHPLDYADSLYPLVGIGINTSSNVFLRYESQPGKPAPGRFVELFPGVPAATRDYTIPATNHGDSDAFFSLALSFLAPTGISLLAALGIRVGIFPVPITPFPLAIALSIFSAIAAWLIARRAMIPVRRQIAWALGAFLLGPLGPPLLLSLCDWPARETCPSCKKPRVVTRELCEHCGAIFAPPIGASLALPNPIPSSSHAIGGLQAIFRKEIHEKFKWALLALVGLTCLDIYPLWNSVYSPSAGASYLATGLTPLLVIVMPAIAVGFALLQIVPDLQPDKWALLVHRPLQRSTIFWGKVAAGLLLYTIAAGLSYVITLIWFAVAGAGVAPFSPGMILPGIVDILSGIPFYLAAMLAAMRLARRARSRFLCIGAAVLFALFQAWVPEFWMALLITSFASALMLIAACDEFCYRGGRRPQHKIAQSVLGMLHFFGLDACLLLVLWLAVIFVMSTIGETDGVSDDYRIDAAGRIVKVQEQGSKIISVTDLQGKRLPLVNADAGGRYPFLEPIPLVLPPNQHGASYRSLNRFYRSIIPQSDSSAGDSNSRLLWYYSARDGKLIGYNPDERKLSEVVSATGIVPSGTAAPLTGIHDIRYYTGDGVFSTDHDIYWIRFAKRTVRKVAGLPDVTIRSVVEVRNDDDTLVRLAVVADHEILIYATDGRLLYRGAIDHAGPMYPESSITVAMNHQGTVFLDYVPYNTDPGRPKSPEYIVELSGLGQAKSGRREFLAPDPPLYTNDSVSLVLPLLLPSGALLSAFLAAYGVAHAGIYNPIIFGAQIPAQLPLLWIAFSLGLGFLGAAGCYGIARRCGFTPAATRAWSVGGFLLGPFGALTMFSLYDWPRRETCWVCGKPRVVTRELCEHCGADFAAPIDSSLEIRESELELLEVIA